MTPIALTIAGSDPSGGAGLQADLKTFAAHRVFGMAAVSLITVQNTCGVLRSVLVGAELLREQLAAVFDDAPPHAVKTGALGAREQVEAVADVLCHGAGLDPPLVIDPVCMSKNGSVLLDGAGRSALLERLLPRAALITPNLDEAALLLGRPVGSADQIAAAGRALLALGARAVLIKGGHRAGDPIDVLCTTDGCIELSAQRVLTRHTHGVGCTLSAAIAARLARGADVPTACRLAKRWLTCALATAPGVGTGQGAVNHLAALPEDADP